MSWIDSTSSLTPILRTREDNIQLNTDVKANMMVNNTNIYRKQTNNKEEEKGYRQYEMRRQRQKHNIQQIYNDDHNKWYGDQLVFSDKWVSGEYNETFRVGAININGISKCLDWIEWDILVQNMRNLQIDMFGVTEPNINFNNQRVTLQIREIAKKTDKNLQIATSCSNQLNSTEKKMGGTMSILSGRWAGRKDGTDKDAKGRWSTMTLMGKKGRRISLITAYRVCQQKGGVGSTVYHQQQIDFEEEGKRDVNLRTQFCRDLAQYIRNLHSNNNVVILMGDFNDDLNIDGGQVNTMLSECSMSNVMHYKNGSDTKLPSTYHRGKKCLDMIAITNDPSVPKTCIVRAGYLPFYHHFCTDHRMVYCDIDSDILFGNVMPDLTRWSNRPFTTNNMKKCNKFKKELRKLYKKANIFNIVEDLEKRFQKARNSEIDTVIQDCIKYGTTAGELLLAAGRKSGRCAYHKGKPYSDELTIVATDLHKKRNLLKLLESKLRCGGTTNQIDKIKTKIREAYKTLKETQREAVKIRNNFLQKLAEKRGAEWNLSTNAALNTIIQAEASKKTFARHGKVMKSDIKGSIKNLTVPVPKYGKTESETKQKEWETIQDEETVYALLLRKNAQQLLRSSQCPFANGKLNDVCGYDGDSKIADQIIEGTLDDYKIQRLAGHYPSVQPELNEFLKAMIRPRNEQGSILRDFSWSYGVKEFRNTFRKTRESTSCGPSGINMSYWKACAEDDDLARVQAFFIEKAFQYSFSYPRWQVSWHCMLQKETTPYLHRLRIIQLFEGDFNGALKYLLGRLLMYHIVNQNKCNTQAFGSIPGRTAHDALITLQLIYDEARINKKVIASMFNDAAGCYDRIRPSLSSLCMQRVGCPKSIAKCHTITQRNMIHKVKTSRGVSNGFIRWSPSQIIQDETIGGQSVFSGNIGGIGQGGGGSPVGWLAMLLVMISTYSQFVTGITMGDPIRKLSLTLYLISYVDDNTLIQQFLTTQTMSSILKGLHKCIMRWHNILKITGGDLALEKCTYCVMKWRWTKGIATLETIDSEAGNLLVNGTTIKRLNPDKGTRVLGVRLAMDGTFKDEFQYRLQQSKNIARTLYKSHLSPIDAYMVYETRFRPALEYPLSVTTFTTSQLQQIQKPFIYLLLPKIGMNRHTPRAIIYGPIYRGGLGLQNLDEKQAILHFELFQGHIRRGDDIGKSLRILTSTQQLEVGCGDLFFNTDPNLYCYSIQHTRLSFLWKKCYKYNIKITLQHAWIPKQYSGGSPTIMDFAVNDKWLKGNKQKLIKINRCRLFLKVMWPTDLLYSRNSDLMNPVLIRGKCPKMNQDLNFPHQTKPDQRSMQMWKEFILRTFCLIQHNPKTGDMEFHLARYSQQLTTELTTTNNDLADLIGSMPTIPCSLKEKFLHLPEKFKAIIGDIVIPQDDGKAIIQSLREGTALLASDGSFLQDQYIGSHAYKLLPDSKSELSIYGSAYSPESDKMSSSPTEHYGALAILTILVVLMYHSEDDSTKWPSSTLLIDNKEVVNRGTNTSPLFLNVRTYLMHDYDLWMLMVELQKNLRMTINFEWIKSHQLAVDYEELSKEDELILQKKVQLNEDVDKLASQKYLQAYTSVSRSAFHAGKVCFHQNGTHIQDITKAISSIDSDQDILKYYVNKGWTMDTLKLVDWISMEKFLKKQTPIARCKIIQMMHNWQNTGSQKQQFLDTEKVKGQNNTVQEEKRVRISLCPLGCNQKEDPFHFMQCTTDYMDESRAQELLLMTKALKKLKTAPSLQEAIIQGIRCWTDNVEYDLDGDSHDLLFSKAHSELLERQEQIGWEFFLKGYLAKDWGHIQLAYYKSIDAHPRKFTRSRWTIRVLQLLHNYRQKLWHLRNASLHGGHTCVTKKVLRQRLLREVKELYARDRSYLSLADKSMFKLPLYFRLRQGSQHLLLWIKRAYITFDTIVDSNITCAQQTRVTEWLQGWRPNHNQQSYVATSASGTKKLVPIHSSVDSLQYSDSQPDIISWLRPTSDRDKVFEISLSSDTNSTNTTSSNTQSRCDLVTS